MCICWVSVVSGFRDFFAYFLVLQCFFFNFSSNISYISILKHCIQIQATKYNIYKNPSYPITIPSPEIITAVCYMSIEISMHISIPKHPCKYIVLLVFFLTKWNQIVHIFCYFLFLVDNSLKIFCISRADAEGSVHWYSYSLFFQELKSISEYKGSSKFPLKIKTFKNKHSLFTNIL